MLHELCGLADLGLLLEHTSLGALMDCEARHDRHKVLEGVNEAG